MLLQLKPQKIDYPLTFWVNIELEALALIYLSSICRQQFPYSFCVVHTHEGVNGVNWLAKKD